jgi:hypothetical protein
MKQYGQHLIVENFQYLSKKRLSPMVLWLTIKKKVDYSFDEVDIDICRCLIFFYETAARL